MASNILYILNFFLPAMIANIAPVFAEHLNIWPSLNKPLDREYSYRDKRILGEHKTIRGIIIGIIAGAIVGLLQGNLILGIGMGVGALWGDACKSLLKRRFNIKSGKSWMPWDQIDFIIGAIIITFPISPQPFINYLIAIIVIGFGSFITSYIGVRMGIKRTYE